MGDDITGEIINIIINTVEWFVRLMNDSLALTVRNLLTLLLAIIISGCSISGNQNGAFTPTQSVSVISIQLTATIDKGSTPSPAKALPENEGIPTITPTTRATKTPLPTSTPYSYVGLPDFSELAINESDFAAEEDGPNLYEFWIDSKDIVNKTNDLADQCEVDCIKVSWGGSPLTLTMIQYSNNEISYQALKSGWNEFLWDENRHGECDVLDDSQDTQWVGLLEPEMGHIVFKLSAVQGPILLTLEYPFRVEGIDLDAAYYCQGLVYISAVQLQKIRAAATIVP